jgi:hypothetical protein
MVPVLAIMPVLGIFTPLNCFKFSRQSRIDLLDLMRFGVWDNIYFLAIGEQV